MYKFKTFNKEEIVENFKTAIKSTVKSISGKDDLEVSFGNKDIQTEKNLIKLPEIEYFNNDINFKKARALADSISLKLRYSDKNIYKNYEPAGSKEKKLYNIAEKIRYETIGTKEFKGIKCNLEEYYHGKLTDQKGTDKVYEAFDFT